jgi:outer membrane protein TolC
MADSSVFEKRAEKSGGVVGALVRARAAVLASLFLAAGWLGEPRAHALQPLDAFLTRASDVNPDLRVSQAIAAQRAAEADRAAGSLLPSFQAQGTYTRNQYEVAFPASLIGGSGTLTILPQNQLDGSLTLSVPLVDVGAWDRRTEARANRDGASADLASTRLEVARSVARAYFQLLANEAVLLSARHNLDLSRDNAALTATKRQDGTASELDVQRARGDVASGEQQLAKAELSVAMGRRALETLSGLQAEPATTFPEDDLRPEAPLEQWFDATERLPLVQSAAAARRSAEASASVAGSSWIPTLTASAQERLTNAPSLTLHNEYYLLQLTAAWKLDATIPANVRAQRAAAQAAVARADKARRGVEDSIFNDWNQVRVSIEVARAARVQVAAAQIAAGLAHDRYQGGIATQLDVLQARQDLFRADVSRIQADADLGFARASLRVDAARSIGETRP